MKVTIAQLNPKVGDFEGNLAKALSAMAAAEPDSPDLIVFSELFLTGYPPQDLLERKWFIRRQEEALAVLARKSMDRPETGLVIGAALPNNLDPGRGLYNAALLIHRGEIVFSQAKSLLPTYDVFDEARYFDPAREMSVAAFKGRRIGLCVCEDAWNDPGFWPDSRLYSRNPIDDLASQGISLLVNVSASPFHVGKDDLRFRLIRHHAVRHQVPFVFVNQVGGNDELIFDGRSMCFDGQGRTIAYGPAFREHLETVDTSAEGRDEPFQPQHRIESVHQALILGIRDYLEKSGFSRAVVGLSGGIDSAVTYVLAVEAMGADNVLGISMPSMYSSTGSVEDSRQLAANLGREIQVVPIKGIYDAYIQALADPFGGRPPDVTEENIQARIRGNILMAVSNKFGHLVLSTGNKSELSMGYCTLYGDMSGGLSVISDLPKTMVYDLARYINREREIIPRAIIDKAPSAELRPDQKDEDSLPPYPVLDRILQLFVEEGLSSREIVARGFEEETVRWVIRTVNRNEYKRKQAAPGLRVNSKAFGVGRRMPIVAHHEA